MSKSRNWWHWPNPWSLFRFYWVYIWLCICQLTPANSANLGFQFKSMVGWIWEFGTCPYRRPTLLAILHEGLEHLWTLVFMGNPGATSLWISWDDYTCIPLCVWSFITRVLWCSHPPKTDIWLPQSSLMLPLHTLPNSWQSLICSHCYNFVISQILYK